MFVSSCRKPLVPEFQSSRIPKLWTWFCWSFRQLFWSCRLTDVHHFTIITSTWTHWCPPLMSNTLMSTIDIHYHWCPHWCPQPLMLTIITSTHWCPPLMSITLISAIELEALMSNTLMSAIDIHYHWCPHGCPQSLMSTTTDSLLFCDTPSRTANRGREVSLDYFIYVLAPYLS